MPNIATPVSYTHLDVYKRQAVQTLTDAGRAVLVRRALEELQDNVHSVSYTHLEDGSAATGLYKKLSAITAK